MNDDERAILAFEERYPRNDRVKEAAVRETFGISWIRYRQVLLRLVRRADVLEEFAMVAHRVQRNADRQVRARAERRLA